MSTYSESDEATVVDERPAKRQRRDPGPPSCRQLLLEEVDLEIALRERLLKTIQSRITWALLLQEHTSRAVHSTNDTTFRDASIDALEAAEAPCFVLFDRPLRPIERLAPVSATPTSVDTPSEATATIPLPPQPPSRTRGVNRSSRAPPKKLLFLRNTTVFPAQIVKLACSDCSRTDFSSLQGLLNHCRLRHHREFGSHDECVQSSAVLVEGEEQQSWVVANGTEVAGISLPGLRRLFEIAVGGSHAILPVILPSAATQPVGEPVSANSDGAIIAAGDINAIAATSLLTRTLGHHEDTPALAPFLGRAPKKRRINLYETDEVADLFGGSDERLDHRIWRPRYAGRSQTINIPTDVDPSPPTSLVIAQPGLREHLSPHQGLLHGVAGSRFHILVRVAVEDYSFWIPSNKRSQSFTHHTHRWRLHISSPSYSIPLISFLDKITIKCLTDPPPSTFSHPIILEGPPFVVTGITDHPFLASLEFAWASPERNAPMIVEHWVELDPLRLNTPVSGDQQVFDVELDRNTELLPVRVHSDIVSWDAVAVHPNAHEDTSVGLVVNYAAPFENDRKKDQTSNSPEHERLAKLLSQVPLTLKDVKGRLTREMPYHMASTPMHFLNLVHGRRKAVEWARARTLRELYEKACADDASDKLDEPPRSSLTIVDVYRWLEAEGHFPRDVKAKVLPSRPKEVLTDADVEESSSSTRSALYCHRCGLHISYHTDHQAHSASTATQARESVSIVETSWTACTDFVAESSLMPVVDVGKVMNSRRTGPSSDLRPPFPLPLNALLAAADPDMVLAIQALLQRSNLPCYGGIGDSEMSASTKSDIETALAPPAILSLLARSMAKLLLRGGVEVYRQDEKASQRQSGRGRASITDQMKKQVLTPSHILRGMGYGALGDDSLRIIAALVIGRLETERSE